MSETIKAWIVTPNFGLWFEATLPAKKEVCPRCRGKGTHVNPSIDGNGITSDEMEELGDEFLESYLSGVYDVKCHECNGLRVVDVIDRKRVSKKVLRALVKAEIITANEDRESAFERKYCC